MLCSSPGGLLLHTLAASGSGLQAGFELGALLLVIRALRYGTFLHP